MKGPTLFPLEHPALQHMSARLKDLGYRDLRSNVPLTAFSDMKDTAALLGAARSAAQWELATRAWPRTAP